MRECVFFSLLYAFHVFLWLYCNSGFLTQVLDMLDVCVCVCLSLAYDWISLCPMSLGISSDHCKAPHGSMSILRKPNQYQTSRTRIYWIQAKQKNNEALLRLFLQFTRAVTPPSVPLAPIIRQVWAVQTSLRYINGLTAERKGAPIYPKEVPGDMHAIDMWHLLISTRPTAIRGRLVNNARLNRCDTHVQEVYVGGAVRLLWGTLAYVDALSPKKESSMFTVRAL